VLLGHLSENITTHYSMPRLRELLEVAERVVEAKDSPSLVRLIGGVAVQGPPRVPQKKAYAASSRPLVLEFLARPAGFEPTTPWFVGSPRNPLLFLLTPQVTQPRPYHSTRAKPFASA